jgi:hypothetical protein
MPNTTAGTGTTKASPVDPVQRAVELVTQSVDEWTTATKSSFDRALAGKYSAEDLVGDLSGAVARGVRDWARMFTAAADLLTSVATAPVPEEAKPGERPPTATPATGTARAAKAPTKRARS